MKRFIPFLIIAVIFASCTTAYKTGQTPDDVYYSPARPQPEYVRVSDREERRNERRQEELDEYNEERYMRMMVRNRSRWAMYDQDYYCYDSRFYRYNNFHFNSPWTSHMYWNNFYNPYAPVIIMNPRTTVYNRPRTVNLFHAPNPTTNNPKASSSRGNQYGTNTRTHRNDDGGNAGGILRGIFNNGGSNNSSSGNTSSGGGGGIKSGGGGGGNAPVRRF